MIGGGTTMTERKDLSIPIFYEAVNHIAATRVVSSSAVASLCSLITFIPRAVGETLKLGLNSALYSL